MPEENTRIVVVGARRADKVFALYVKERKLSEKRARKVAQQTKRLEVQVKRELRQLRTRRR